jgi:hypothetical protein
VLFGTLRSSPSHLPPGDETMYRGDQFELYGYDECDRECFENRCIDLGERPDVPCPTARRA